MKTEFFIRFKLDCKNAYDSETDLHRTIVISQTCDIDGLTHFPFGNEVLKVIVKEQLDHGWDFDCMQGRKTYFNGTEYDWECYAENEVIREYIKDLLTSEKSTEK